MTQRKIPDRSAEPAVQESLDAEESNTAATSDEVDTDGPEARDDEGNAIDVAQTPDEVPAKPRPDSEAGSQ